MAITQLNPNRVRLSGTPALINDLVASEAITPGHLVLLADDSGTNKWKKCDSASSFAPFVAVEQTEMNLGIDDDYAISDLVKVDVLQAGDTFYGLIASGQNISNSEYLVPGTNGTLTTGTAWASAAVKYQSLDNPGAVTVLTRIRVQVIA